MYTVTQQCFGVFSLLAVLLAYFLSSHFFSQQPRKMGKFNYPEARRDESVIDDYHGTKISDPYRWLEDPDSEETKAFVDAQNEISQPFVEACSIRPKIQERVREIWDYPKYGCPKKRGSKYYYFHNTGLQNQRGDYPSGELVSKATPTQSDRALRPVDYKEPSQDDEYETDFLQTCVMYAQDTIDSEPTVYFDPNKLSTEGTVSLRGTSFSDDGSLWAYGLSESGSDWITMRVFFVADSLIGGAGVIHCLYNFKKAPSGEDLPDALKHVKFTSMAWTHDNKGIFYNRYDITDGKSDGTETTSNLNQKLYYHRLGTDQSEDVLVAETPENPRWMIGAEMSDCGKYLVMTPREGCDPVNKLYMVDLHSLKDGINGILPYTVIVDNFDAEYEFIYNNGPVFTFKTNKDASRYKVINIDMTKPEPENWVTVIGEHETAVVEWASVVNKNKIVVCYLHHVKSELVIHDFPSGAKEYELPLEVGSIIGFSGIHKDTEIFYLFMSYLTPGKMYHVDMTAPTYEPKLHREVMPSGFHADRFEIVQKFYPSKDGTKIPMFIIHKKDLELDGSHPVVLYGYGGFSISITPSFSPARSVYLQHLGGVYAVANIRGGNEYGESWHKDGSLGNKQSGFDDFQAAAQFLVDNNYTSPGKIVINGASNGGLLVGACLNQRPDLFAGGIAQVGVLDMLRFHLFTIGHAWITDYGSSEDAEQFQWLIKYSPLHNIPKEPKGGQYPALLMLTGDHDDRVVPLHSLKFMAQLQYTLGKNEKQTNPLIIRVDTDSGHGFGKPTAKVIDEIADMYSFICQTVGLQWTD